jgi:hypothetical protein
MIMAGSGLRGDHEEVQGSRSGTRELGMHDGSGGGEGGGSYVLGGSCSNGGVRRTHGK